MYLVAESQISLSISFHVFRSPIENKSNTQVWIYKILFSHLIVMLRGTGWDCWTITVSVCLDWGVGGTEHEHVSGLLPELMQKAKLERGREGWLWKRMGSPQRFMLSPRRWVWAHSCLCAPACHPEAFLLLRLIGKMFSNNQWRTIGTPPKRPHHQRAVVVINVALSTQRACWQ